MWTRQFRLNGRTIWVWIFLDPEAHAVLYVLRSGRRRDVLPRFKGVIVCDGWKPAARGLYSAAGRTSCARPCTCAGASAQPSRARRARARASLLGRITRIAVGNCGNAVARGFLDKLERAAAGLL